MEAAVAGLGVDGLETDLRPDGNLLVWRKGHPSVDYIGVGWDDEDDSYLNAAVHQEDGEIDDGYCWNVADYGGSVEAMLDGAVLPWLAGMLDFAPEDMAAFVNDEFDDPDHATRDHPAIHASDPADPTGIAISGVELSSFTL